MKLDFLKDFSARMKKVGIHTLIDYNSMFKSTWKSYGFEESYEYINLIYAVMMFIMEQSLKDEICTLDDIASYIDELNSKFFRKSLTYEQCRALGDFIVNTVLCDEGRAMYFKGYDFEAKGYVDIHISYVNNRIVYINDTVRRTSYYLTDDGYSLLLGTLEVEHNMKLTIQEIIFNLHFEKADYGKAVDDIKQIFNLSRVIGEQQKILNIHFGFKNTYSETLTGMTAVAAIKRISFNSEVYEPILAHVSRLSALDSILRPLYISRPWQSCNINKISSSRGLSRPGTKSLRRSCRWMRIR